MSHEIPKDYCVDGMLIAHDYLKNRFQKTDNLQTLGREDGSIIDIKLVADNISYHGKGFVVVTPPLEKSGVFGAPNYIVLQVEKKDKNTSYLPVENDKTVIAVSKLLFQKLDQQTEEKLSKVFERLKKADFEFNLRNSF